MTAFQIFTALLGRICFSLYFIVAGIQNILHWEAGEQQLSENLSVLLATYNHSSIAVTVIDFLLNYPFEFFVFLTSCKLLGGVFVLLGIRVRTGAFLLFLYLLTKLFLVYRVWPEIDIEKSDRLLTTLYDVSLLGATLILLCVGKRVLISGGTRGEDFSGK